jgi:hypothetical protein
MTNETVKKNQENRTGERLAIVETKIDAVNRNIEDLARRVDELSQNITNHKASKQEVDALKESFIQRTSALEGKIKALEDERTWLIRLIIGAVALALLGLVLVVV